MAHVSYSEFRANLASDMDAVVDGRVPLVVTRQGGKGNVVMLSEEEFAGWHKTVHLLSNPRNAAHLLESIQQADAGLAAEHDLIEP